MGMNGNPAPRRFLCLARSLSLGDHFRRRRRELRETLRAFATARLRNFLAWLSWKRKRRKTRRGRHLVAKTQAPARQFARVIVLVGASCTIGTGAVAFWVGIALGANSSVTGFPSEAARSMIRPEGFPATLGPPSTLHILIGPKARDSSPSGSSPALDGRRIGCGDGGLTGRIRKPRAIQREYGRLFGAPRARDIAPPLAAGGCRQDGRT